MVRRPGRRFLRELQRNNAASGATTPEVPAALLRWLEAAYPARCRGMVETERAHERYAGKVELVAQLRGIFDQYLDPAAQQDEVEAFVSALEKSGGGTKYDAETATETEVK